MLPFDDDFFFCGADFAAGPDFFGAGFLVMAPVLSVFFWLLPDFLTGVSLASGTVLAAVFLATDVVFWPVGFFASFPA
ncbi:MAG TPA: hypothetical protein VJ436_10090 [Anaerolineales bacterium]|nr:hypothetical protein [Anaerolineales bacterium]